MIFGTSIGSGQMRKILWEEYFNNSVDVPGKETEIYCKACKKIRGIYIAGNYRTRGKKSILHTAILFSFRKLNGKHRKIKPTAAERLVWGEGDGQHLSTHKISNTVYRNSYMLGKLYAHLQGWHYILKGVNIYLAPTADNRESWQATLKHIAQEGRCFVIGANQFVSGSDYPANVALMEGIKTE